MADGYLILALNGMLHLNLHHVTAQADLEACLQSWAF